MKNDERPIFNGYYSTKYNQIVEPRKIWSCSKYFLRRWAPILDPNRFWTIIAARHLAYLSDGESQFQAFDRQLSDESKISMRQVSRIKQEMLESSALSVFLTRQPTKRAINGGVVRSEMTDYSVRLDTPLTPADALEVSHWINELRSNKASSIEEQLNLVLDSADPGLLIPAVPQKIDKHLVAWNGYTVTDLFSHANLKPYAQESDHIHQLLTGSAYVGTQYFRNNWVGILGAGPAYLISWMRSYCFADSNELRNELTVDKKGLSKQLYISGKQLSRWIKPLIDWGFLTELGRSQTSDRKKLITYQVNLMDPLTAADLALYEGVNSAGGHFGSSRKEDHLLSDGHFGSSNDSRRSTLPASNGHFDGRQRQQEDILAVTDRQNGSSLLDQTTRGHFGSSIDIEKALSNHARGQNGGSNIALTDKMAESARHNDGGQETNWLTSNNYKLLKTIFGEIPKHDLDGWHLQFIDQPTHHVISHMGQADVFLKLIGIDTNSQKYQAILKTKQTTQTLLGQWLQTLDDVKAEKFIGLFIHRAVTNRAVQQRYLDLANLAWGEWLNCVIFSLLPVNEQLDHIGVMDSAAYKLWSSLQDRNKDLFSYRSKILPLVDSVMRPVLQELAIEEPLVGEDIGLLWTNASERLKADMGGFYDIFLGQSQILSATDLVKISVSDRTAQAYLYANGLAFIKQTLFELSGEMREIEFVVADQSQDDARLIGKAECEPIQDMVGVEEAWKAILAELELAISKPLYAQTFKNAEIIAIAEDSWRVKLKNQQAVDVASQRLSQIVSSLTEAIASGIAIEFVTDA